MAGGKTISENYAFAGMHHIFDQHTSAGNKHISFFASLLKVQTPLTPLD
jgi:hypothetical protein